MVDLPRTKHMNTSAWPVVVYVAPSQVSDAEMDEVIAEERALKATERVHALILDLRNSAGITPLQRKRLTSGMSADAELSARVTAAVALVFSSPVLRGILTAIFWVRPAVAPTRVFGDVASASRWCQEKIDGKLRTSAEATHDDRHL